MKWITHQTGAIIAALALQMPAQGIIAAGAASVLPDVIDQGISRMGGTKKRRQAIFNKIHRGSSHWFGWWLAIFLSPLAFPGPALANEIMSGIGFGALTHVFLDMLTTRGTPLLPFTRKCNFSLRLCSTGTAGEYIFLALMTAAAIYFWVWPVIL